MKPESILDSQRLLTLFDTYTVVNEPDKNKPKARRLTKKVDVKKNVLPHTNAKLALYSAYLKKYLAILNVAQSIEHINIFDIFCGAGIYQDGNVGSPIIAFNIIHEVQEFIDSMKNQSFKSITLYLNDLNEQNIKRIKEYLSSKEKHQKCEVNYNSYDADTMIENALHIIKNQPRNHRNLVFLDPYGYSKIRKEMIEVLMKTHRVEIILFLPASHMHRFKDVVQEQERKDYEALRSFIFTFFEESHPIRTKTDKISIIDFIDYIKAALSFNDKYFTTSFYLQRDKSNYYALFFITTNVLGLERLIDAKWEQDAIEGKGFSIENIQFNLFTELNKDSRLNKKMFELRILILDALKSSGKLNNNELYLLGIKNDFRGKHITSSLTSLYNDNMIETEKMDGSKPRKGAFYIGYKYYATKKAELIVTLKQI